MSESINSLLEEIPASGGEGFNVRRLPDGSAYYVGRDSDGRACLLIHARGLSCAVPLHLAGLEVHFALDCNVQEPGLPEETKTLSVIVCLSRASVIEAYFSSIAELFVRVLGPAPAADQVRDAVDQFVQLFQKLEAPARRSLTGVLGELCFIHLAADKDAAVRGWRVDPEERFDFICGDLRVDVKASAQRLRVHEVSFDQANPSSGSIALFASIWIEPVGGGTTFSTFLGTIERGLADIASVAKLREVVADTLGSTLPGAMNFRFDLHTASQSIQLFDARRVPALRPPLPTGLSGVRFASNFALAVPEDLPNLKRSLKTYEAVLLPS